MGPGCQQAASRITTSLLAGLLGASPLPGRVQQPKPSGTAEGYTWLERYIHGEVPPHAEGLWARTAQPGRPAEGMRPPAPGRQNGGARRTTPLIPCRDYSSLHPSPYPLPEGSIMHPLSGAKGRGDCWRLPARPPLILGRDRRQPAPPFPSLTSLPLESTTLDHDRC